MASLATESSGDTTSHLYAAALCHVLGRPQDGARLLREAAVPNFSRVEHKLPFVEAILVATLGPERYLGLFNGKTAWDDPDVKKAMEILLKSHEYAQTGYESVKWGDINEIMTSENAPKLAKSPDAKARKQWRTARPEKATIRLDLN